MNAAIRHALVALPVGLFLSGCAGPQRTKASYGQTTEPSTSTAVLVIDPNNELPAHPPAGQAATERQYDITLEQIGGHLETNSAVVIDARNPEQFARGHIRGAINVPAGQIEDHLGLVHRTVRADQLIIIYCGSSSCGSGEVVYEYLTAQGYTNMRVYKPGWQKLVLAKELQ